MTAVEWFGAAGVAVAALTAGGRVYTWGRNERRRGQPIVVLYEKRRRGFGGSGDWIVQAWLRNEGVGPAFNVQFGVEYHGVRIPFEHPTIKSPSGFRYRVIQPGQRIPEKSAILITITSEQMWSLAAKAGDPDSSARYWARYENATGDTWETVNPGDPGLPLEIRRVWSRKRAERREQQDRERLPESLRAVLEGASEPAGSDDVDNS